MSKHVSFTLLSVTQVTQTSAFPIPFAQLSYSFTSSPPMQQARQYSSFSAIHSALHFTAIQFNSIQFNQFQLNQFNGCAMATVQHLLYSKAASQKKHAAISNNSNPNKVLQAICRVIQVTLDIMQPSCVLRSCALLSTGKLTTASHPG